MVVAVLDAAVVGALAETVLGARRLRAVGVGAQVDVSVISGAAEKKTRVPLLDAVSS
jgi:hypothetical protein